MVANLNIEKSDSIVVCKNKYKNMPIEISYKTNRLNVYNIYNEELYTFIDLVNETLNIYKKVFKFISPELPEESYYILGDEILKLCKDRDYKIDIFLFDWDNDGIKQSDIHKIEMYKGSKKIFRCEKGVGYKSMPPISFEKYYENQKKLKKQTKSVDKMEEV